MLNGIPLIDAHVHAPHRGTLKPAWIEWARIFGRGVPLDELYVPDGRIIPERFDTYMEGEGVDTALRCVVRPNGLAFSGAARLERESLES
jgi:hypothetical protein